MFGFLRFVYRLACILGHSELRYDVPQQKFERLRHKWSRVFYFCVVIFNATTPIFYIAMRIYTEVKNGVLNELEAGFRRPLNIVDCIQRISTACSFFILYIRLVAKPKKLLHLLSNILKVLKFVQDTMKEQICCPRKLQFLGYFLILRMSLKAIANILLIRHIAIEYDGADFMEYVANVCLYISYAVVYMHFGYFYLHFMVQAAIFHSFNSFFERKVSMKHKKLYLKILQILPLLRKIELNAATYFALIYAWYHVESFEKFAVFFGSLMAYDDKSLDSHFLYRDPDYEDEVNEHIAAKAVTSYTRPQLILQQTILLVFLFLDVIMLLFVANVVKREKSFFQLHLLNLQNYPEFFDEGAPSNEVNQKQASAILEQTTDEIRPDIPKRNFIDYMLNNNIAVYAGFDTKLCLIRLYTIEIDLKYVTWLTKLLIKSALLAILMDQIQLAEIAKFFKPKQT